VKASISPRSGRTPSLPRRLNSLTSLSFLPKEWSNQPPSPLISSPSRASKGSYFFSYLLWTLIRSWPISRSDLVTPYEPFQCDFSAERVYPGTLFWSWVRYPLVPFTLRTFSLSTVDSSTVLGVAGCPPRERREPFEVKETVPFSRTFMKHFKPWEYSPEVCSANPPW